MTRSLTTAVKNAITAQTAEYVHLYLLDFGGGNTQRITDGATDLSVDVGDGNGLVSWDAVGGAIQFEPIGEGGEIKNQSVRVAFGGADLSIITDLLLQDYIARDFKIWRAHFSGASVIADPILIFSGTMSGGARITEKRKHRDATATVEITAVSDLALLNRVSGVQTNRNSHEAALQAMGLAAGTIDKLFDVVPKNARKVEPWGKRAVEG